MLSAVALTPVSFHAPVLPAPATRSTGVRMEEEMGWLEEAGYFVVGAQPIEKDWGDSTEISDAKGLADLAKKLNPAVGYWDPFQIGSADKELIAWFRHAEIKHGRIAMFGFVGFCVQSAGLYWPYKLQGLNSPTIYYSDISAAGGPGDQWDALPTPAKLQILFVIGLLEFASESKIVLEACGQKHYVRGGKPGQFPSFKKAAPALGFPAEAIPFDFFDPFNLQSKMTPEQKERGLLAEINNGRLAMLGLIGLLSASKGLIVPGLDSLPIAPYKGEYMAYFSAVNSDLPFVSDMLASPMPWAP